MLGDCLGDSVAGGVGIGDVGRDRGCLAATLGQLGDESVEPVLAASDGHHGRSELRQVASGRLADSAARAGDERDGAVETLRHHATAA